MFSCWIEPNVIVSAGTSGSHVWNTPSHTIWMLVASGDDLSCRTATVCVLAADTVAAVRLVR